jgi:hypothetical protein
MMPQNHFLVAAIITVLFIMMYHPELDRAEATTWVLVAGLVAALIDVDVILMVRLKARTDPELRPYTDMRVVAKDLQAMLSLLHWKGLLVKVAVPHVISASLLTVASYFLAPSIFIPVFLGAWSHLVSDVPYVRAIMRRA